MRIKGSAIYKTERICTTYINTGRTMRSLAEMYECDVHTIYRYLHKYCYELLDWDTYQSVLQRAKQNKDETYKFGQSENRYSNELGPMD